MSDSRTAPTAPTATGTEGDVVPALAAPKPWGAPGGGSPSWASGAGRTMAA
jgi:hypothetical protein